jgi:hypothetical protein
MQGECRVGMWPEFLHGQLREGMCSTSGGDVKYSVPGYTYIGLHRLWTYIDIGSRQSTTIEHATNWLAYYIPLVI